MKKKLIQVRHLKQPCSFCRVCRDKGVDIFAPHEIILNEQRYASVWVCNEHLEQFKSEAKSL